MGRLSSQISIVRIRACHRCSFAWDRDGVTTSSYFGQYRRIERLRLGARPVLPFEDWRMQLFRYTVLTVLFVASVALYPLAAWSQVSPQDAWGVHKIWAAKEVDEYPFVRGGYITREWADINPSPGVFDFSFFEAELERYAALGKPTSLALRGTYKPEWLFNEVPYHPDQLSQQVKNDRGTLAYWHPQLRQRHNELLQAFAEFARQSPYRDSIYAIRLSLNALGTEHSGIDESERARDRWIVPAGVDWVPYTDAVDDAYKGWVTNTYYDLFAADFLLLVRSNLFSGDDGAVPPDVKRAVEDGRVGLFHTSSVPEPTKGSTERKYDVHLQYAREGKTTVYAEPFSESTKGSRGEQPPAQWNYWRILSDLHSGVTYISVYGVDLEQYTNSEYLAAFNFANRYAGYQTGNNAALSPGAWVALREGDFLKGDYDFLMSRMSGDDNLPVSGVGPDRQRFGAWARRIPANGRIQFQIDDELAGAISGQAVTLRITYFDARSPRFTVTAAGGIEQTIRGSATSQWRTIEVPVDSAAFASNSGADVTISANTDVTLHMVEVIRTAILEQDNRPLPEPPGDVS